MNSEERYERRDAAGRMNASMVIVASVAVFAAILAFLRYGWLPSLGFLILGAIAFALSQVFDLLGDLVGSSDQPEKRAMPPVKERAQHETKQ
jgi:hypothetical protein